MQDERTIGEVGEFELIDLLNRNLGGRTRGVVAGVGDDTAVVRLEPGNLLLATCDAQVEGIHFLPQLTTPDGIGWKAITVNVSDIAAMAGTPRYALLSLAMPSTTPLAFVQGVYDGIRLAADAYQIDVVGGNMARSPDTIFIDVTLLGEVAPEAVAYRRGARVGDVLLVTGWPGESAAGLALLLTDPMVTATLPTTVVERLRRAHLWPQARVAEGHLAGAHDALHALIDVSDGLAPDLGHICDASQCGAMIDAARLPVSDELRQAANALGQDPIDFVLSGGEAYELLMAVEPGAATDISRAIEDATNTPVTAIGQVRPAAEGRYVQLADGTRVPLPGPLFRHFSESS